MANKTRLEAKSADYSAMEKYWTKAHDIVEGEDAIVLAGQKYLPRFPDESDSEYTYRLGLARFTNIYRDILEGLASKPFEQEITLTQPESPPEQLTAFLDDVDGSGNNISVFSMDTFFNGINSAVDFIFVDYEAKLDNTSRSQADEQAMGLRPFWSHILCTNVYEIQSRIIAGKEQLSYVRIFEPESAISPKSFREMFKVGDVATYKLWVYDQKSDDYTLTTEGVITIGYIPLVPFVTGRRKGKTWQFHPPMKDAVDLQIKLYRAESNLEATKTAAAFPMLVGVGVKPREVDGVVSRLVVGPGVTLYAPATAAGGTTDWHYIEPGSQTLTFLATDIKDIKMDLRELGRQPLTVNSGNLTTITTAVAANKSKSAVRTWGIGLTDCLTICLYYTVLWFKMAGVQPSVKVYDGYDDVLDAGTDGQLLLTAVSQGKLSTRTWWSEMQRRNILSNEFDADEELALMLQDVPNGTPDPNNPNGV